MEIKYPNITVELCGHDGNAYSIIGRVTRELRRNDVSQEEIELFKKEAMSGDYDNVLQTAMRWVDVT